MPVGQVEKIFALELEIIQKGSNISVEEARRFQSSLIFSLDKFLAYCKEDRCQDSDVGRLVYNFQRAESVQKTTSRLLKHLINIIESGNVKAASSASKNETVDVASSKVTDQSTEDLDSLRRKQTVFTEMIDSLAPEGELTAEQAAVRYELVLQAYDKFTTNHSEIMTIVKDTAFEDQFAVCMDVHRKVVSLLESLKKILPNEPVVLSKPTSSTDSNSKVNDQSANDQSADSVKLNSLLQKQNYYITVINSLAPEVEISLREAELEYGHLTQYYEKFSSNQCEITTLVKDDAYDNQMNIWKDTHRKVLSLQKTLKDIFSPLETRTLFSKPKKNERNKIESPNYIANFLGLQCKTSELPIKSTVLSKSESKPVLSNGTEGLNDAAGSPNSAPELIKPGSSVEQEQIESNGDLFTKGEMLQDEPSTSVENQTRKTSEAGSSSTTLPTVEEVCSRYGLNDVKIEYTDADFQSIITYKSFGLHFQPTVALENPKASNWRLSMLTAAKWRDFLRQNPYIQQTKYEVDDDPEYTTKATRTRSGKFRRSAEIYEYEDEKPNAKKSRSRSTKRKTTKKNNNAKASPYEVVLCTSKRPHESSDEDERKAKHAQVLVPMLNLEQSQ